MSELIRREDVRREIQASFNNGAFRWQDGQNLMDRINALPTASPWRRVEEPPKENGRYFASWEGAVTTDEYKNGVWLYASMFNQRITHWMPLPEPPKEVNHEGI